MIYRLFNDVMSIVEINAFSCRPTTTATTTITTTTTTTTTNNNNNNNNQDKSY